MTPQERERLKRVFSGEPGLTFPGRAAPSPPAVSTSPLPPLGGTGPVSRGAPKKKRKYRGRGREGDKYVAQLQRDYLSMYFQAFNGAIQGGAVGLRAPRARPAVRVARNFEPSPGPIQRQRGFVDLTGKYTQRQPVRTPRAGRPRAAERYNEPVDDPMQMPRNPLIVTPVTAPTPATVKTPRAPSPAQPSEIPSVEPKQAAKPATVASPRSVGGQANSGAAGSGARSSSTRRVPPAAGKSGTSAPASPVLSGLTDYLRSGATARVLELATRRIAQASASRFVDLGPAQPSPRATPDPFSQLLESYAPRLTRPAHDTCECEKKKPKKKTPRAPRDVCRSGTYTQTARGIRYSPHHIVPCT